MKLLTLQRQMGRAVMTPLTRSERMRPVAPDGRSLRAVASRIIKPNARLTSFERLEIYNRQYWFRVSSALAEDFAGLQAVLGGRQFDTMARAYLTDLPSQSFTLRNLGARLVGWLQNHTIWAGPRKRLALDMARLEWAEIEAFDGKQEPSLKPESLAEMNPAHLRLRLQPYIRLLTLHYPVDGLLLEVRKGTSAIGAASNTFNERKKRKHVTKVARLEPSAIFLAVHRMDDEVYFRRLDQQEFVILSSLRAGKSLTGALAAARSGTRNMSDPVAQIEKWFRTWSTLGWFCGAERNSKGKGRSREPLAG
jgi:hypothetical protein